jgi:hypothetical protein
LIACRNSRICKGKTPLASGMTPCADRRFHYWLANCGAGIQISG